MANDDKKDSNDPSVDPLLLTKVFPEAYAVFSFRPKTLDEVFATATFVLDTNALLVPYSLGKTSLDEIGKHSKTKRNVATGRRLEQREYWWFSL